MPIFFSTTYSCGLPSSSYTVRVSQSVSPSMLVANLLLVVLMLLLLLLLLLFLAEIHSYFFLLKRYPIIASHRRDCATDCVFNTLTDTAAAAAAAAAVSEYTLKWLVHNTCVQGFFRCRNWWTNMRFPGAIWLGWAERKVEKKKHRGVTSSLWWCAVEGIIWMAHFRCLLKFKLCADCDCVVRMSWYCIKCALVSKSILGRILKKQLNRIYGIFVWKFS